MLNDNPEKQKAIIQRFIDAYNDFDVDGMVALVHKDVVFNNVSGGKVNATAVGIENFRELALQSRKMFSSRYQKANSFAFAGKKVTVDISYEGVLSVDLPNGIKAGEAIRLKGRSEFEFKDGKLYRITDIS